MGRRGRWILATILAVALQGGCALGGAERAPRSNGMGRLSVVSSQNLGLEQVEGYIKAIDRERGVVIVDRKPGELNLYTDSETMIYVSGGTAHLEDLVEGAPIRASYQSDAGDHLARWIEIPRDNEPPPPPEAPGVEPPNEEGHQIHAPPGGAAP